MKRKTKTGVKLLTQVIDRMKAGSKPVATGAKRGGDDGGSQTSLSSNSKLMIAQDNYAAEAKGQVSIGGDEKDYIYPLLYIYRAYGYIVLEDYDKGLKDFLKSSQIKKLNASQNYNMILC